MKAAILSAGKGRRLASVTGTKGLLKIGGLTLLERTLRTLERLKYEEVFIVLRKDAVLLEKYLLNLRPKLKLTFIRKNSRSPYYSTKALKQYVKREGILVFNVDAYFQPKDLEGFTRFVQKGRASGKDMVLWAMRYSSEFEDPAFIRTNRKGEVVDYGKSITPCDLIFGQIRYCSARALNATPKSIKGMRQYILHLIQKKYPVGVYRTQHPVYDVDTPEDYRAVLSAAGRAR